MDGSGYIYVSVWSNELWSDQDISMYLYGVLNYGWIRIYISMYLYGVLNYGWIRIYLCICMEY